MFTKKNKLRTTSLMLAAMMSALGNGAFAGMQENCPNPLVIQTDWLPTPERALAYHLAGADGVVDAQKGRYLGTLKGTNVKVEVRVGGAFVGFSPVTALMYQDPSIFLGFVQTDQAVENFAKQPTVSVLASLDINPQVLMYDPAQYDFKTIADIGKTDATVLYFEGLPFMDYLLAKGILKKNQVDASFDGSPSRFIASGGKVVVTGYASNEPYRYENDIKNWKKPVASLLINDAGYEIYPENLAVRPETIAKYKDCLTELVPVMQQAIVDYTRNPEPTNKILIKLSEALKVPVPLTAAGNSFAVKTMLDLKLISNGSNNTVGDFDMERVQRVIEQQLRPTFSARGTEVPPNLKASQVHTNEFIDTKIGL